MDPLPTICVADDDPDVLRSVSFLIRTFGFEVVAYASGSELFADFHNQQPACILLDQRMPGMSGTDVVRALRDLGSAVPIFLISGHAVAEMKSESLGLAVQWLEKPMDSYLLEAALRSATGK